MPNYKNPLAAKKDKPKIKTYNFTEEQLGISVPRVLGRVLGPEYLWFSGDGVRNWFRDSYGGGNLMVFGG